mmetsp:Transcript_7182/g.15634  ORF Transcript_7182/g.15634 Transcript_7182/m.15634 type:complete len:205 (-) Transcript_7182:1524-2138(-)
MGANAARRAAAAVLWPVHRRSKAAATVPRTLHGLLDELDVDALDELEACSRGEADTKSSIFCSVRYRSRVRRRGNGRVRPARCWSSCRIVTVDLPRRANSGHSSDTRASRPRDGTAEALRRVRAESRHAMRTPTPTSSKGIRVPRVTCPAPIPEEPKAMSHSQRSLGAPFRTACASRKTATWAPSIAPASESSKSFASTAASSS